MTLFGLSPLALAALIAGTTAALFVLHRLRVRPEVRRVPTLLFWREAVEETQARTLFGRFRHPRTFAFLCVLAALIAAALADPMTDGARAATRHTVVVVDTSSTVTARLEGAEDGRPVWSAIREDALRILDEAGLRDRVAVVTTSAAGGLVAGFDTPRPVARDATQALSPSAAPGDLPRALERAATLLAGRSHPTIVFLPGPDDAQPMAVELTNGTITIGAEQVPIKWVCHPADRTDQALVGVRYRDTLEVRVAHQRPAGGRTLEVRRQLGDGAPGEVVTRVPVTFDGEGGARWVAVPGLVTDGARLSVRLDGVDGYPGNDALAYQLPLRRTRRVFVDSRLPATARLLVAAHPRLQVTEHRDQADLAVVAGQRLTGPAPAGARVRCLPVGRSFTDGARVSPLPRLRSPVRSIASSNRSRGLFSADEKMLGAIAGEPGVDLVIELSPDLLQPGTGFIDGPAGAAALAAVIEWEAGNRPGSVVAPAARAGVVTSGGSWAVVGAAGEARRFGAAGDGVVRLGGLSPALLSSPDREARSQSLAIHPPGLVPGYDVPVNTPMPELPSASPRLWEWLALIALGFLLVDAWLHTRGRIP